MTRKWSVCVPGLLAVGSAYADWTLNMPKGVTELSAETYRLHMQVFYWCIAIGIVVFGAMFYTLYKHRKSRDVQPASFSHNTRAEVIWTTIPIIILLLMVIPAAETLIRVEDGRNPELTVVITGYQWRWHYAYQDEGIGFFSTLAEDSNAARRKESGVDPSTVENYLLDVDNPLVVPKGAKVRVLLTSKDVVHSWWVPDLAIKKDAIPGYMNQTWFRAEETGVFRGQCAELCGMDHGYMPVVVEVVEPAAYDAWLTTEKEAAAKVAAAGDGTK
ncbi:MAG: cytochrome c oxidase subunit II [Woeseiaceae bacterium]